MDNDSLIWTSFGNLIWPTRYLVDKDGFLRYAHQGEGSYDRFERALQSLLVETGYHGLLPELAEPVRSTDYPGAICLRPTPEIQVGYLRGTIGNPEGHGPESTLNYDDQGVHLVGRAYLKGKWFNEQELVRFDGAPREKGQVSVLYEGLEVNSVLEFTRRSHCKLIALQDGKPLTRENAGVDVSFDSTGRSFLLVDGPRMFNLVSNPEFGRHELTLVVGTPGLALYSLCFTAGVVPELVSSN
jgi:hypothetical protein